MQQRVWEVPANSLTDCSARTFVFSYPFLGRGGNSSRMGVSYGFPQTEAEEKKTSFFTPCPALAFSRFRVTP